jgi:hypothetical protein
MKNKDTQLLEEAYELVLDEGMKDWVKDKLEEFPNLLAITALSVAGALAALGTINNEIEYKQISSIVREVNQEDYMKLKEAHNRYVWATPKGNKAYALIQLNDLIKEYKAKYKTNE